MMTKKDGEKKDEIKKKVQVDAKDVAKAFVKEEPLQEESLESKRIYVGPGKPGLITNTVYSGGFPIFVKEMIEECPAIESLMVRISDYPTAKEKVRKMGTIEYANAKKVLEYFKNEGGKE